MTVFSLAMAWLAANTNNSRLNNSNHANIFFLSMWFSFLYLLSCIILVSLCPRELDYKVICNDETFKVALC